MSKEENTQLLERAYEVMEELTSHPSNLDRRIQMAIDSNDLEDLFYLVSSAESQLSQEHFEAYNV